MSDDFWEVQEGRSQKTMVNLSKRRFVAVFAALAALLSMTLVTATPASSATCSGDTWADWSSWTDNYWVGYNTAGTVSCDLNGRYTLGIQRINWEENYRTSSPDGYYGPNTHTDVRDFQDDYGLTDDGLVGPATWSKYRSRITQAYDAGGGWLYYTTRISGGTYYWVYFAQNNRWYIQIGSVLEPFDTGGY